MSETCATCLKHIVCSHVVNAETQTLLMKTANICSMLLFKVEIPLHYIQSGDVFGENFHVPSRMPPLVCDALTSILLLLYSTDHWRQYNSVENYNTQA